MNSLEFSNIRTKCPVCFARRGLATFKQYPRQPFGYCHSCGSTIMPPKDTSFTTPKQPQKQPPKPIEKKFISYDYAVKSLSNTHIFKTKLLEMGFTKENFKDWLIGADSYGNTLFYYRDANHNIVNAKLIKYKDDLHRDKSVTRFFKSSKQGYGVCIYGEHQLSKDGIVYVVESEKTAFLAGIYLNNIYIAVSGASGIKESAFDVLKGRTIIYLNDADTAGRNSKVYEKLKRSKAAKVIKKELFKDKNDGYDLGDYIIDKLVKKISLIKTFNKFEIDYFEERSAILEYQNGLTKLQAEEEAINHILLKRSKK